MEEIAMHIAAIDFVHGEAGKVRSPLHGVSAIILPELMFLKTYSVRVQEVGYD
jgi:hypothetical protein